MPSETFLKIGDIKVYRSNWVSKGKLIVLGGATKPEDWNSMTKEQQLAWAITYGNAIVINDKEVFYAERV